MQNSCRRIWSEKKQQNNDCDRSNALTSNSCHGCMFSVVVNNVLCRHACHSGCFSVIVIVFNRSITLSVSLLRLPLYDADGSRGWTRMEGCIMSITWRRGRRGNGLNLCPMGTNYFFMILLLKGTNCVVFFSYMQGSICQLEQTQ